MLWRLKAIELKVNTMTSDISPEGGQGGIHHHLNPNIETPPQTLQMSTE